MNVWNVGRRPYNLKLVIKYTKSIVNNGAAFVENIERFFLLLKAANLQLTGQT